MIARDRDRLADHSSRTILDLCCMRSCFTVAQFRISLLKPSLDTEAIRGKLINWHVKLQTFTKLFVCLCFFSAIW